MVGFFHMLFVSPQIRELNIQVDRQRSMFNLADVDPQNPDNFVAGTAIRQQMRLRFWLGQVGEKIESHPPRLHGGIAHLRDSRH